jgi:hypothetical protein
MSDKPKAGGYLWRESVHAGITANHQVCQYLQRLLDERPSPALAATYIAQAAVHLNVNLKALHELERIGSNGDRNGSSPQSEERSTIEEDLHVR